MCSQMLYFRKPTNELNDDLKQTKAVAKRQTGATDAIIKIDIEGLKTKRVGEVRSNPAR